MGTPAGKHFWSMSGMGKQVGMGTSWVGKMVDPHTSNPYSMSHDP